MVKGQVQTRRFFGTITFTIICLKKHRSKLGGGVGVKDEFGLSTNSHFYLIFEAFHNVLRISHLHYDVKQHESATIDDIVEKFDKHLNKVK